MPDISIRGLLAANKILNSIVLPTPIDELLNDAIIVGTPPAVPGNGSGSVKFAAAHDLGVLALNFTPPDGTNTEFHLTTTATSFQCWLVLSSLAPVAKIMKFAEGAAGVVLKAAVSSSDGDQDTLKATGDEVTITGVACALLIEGVGGEEATLRFSPTVGDPGIIKLFLNPPAVLIGDTQFGFELLPDADGTPGAFLIDDSNSAAAPGQTILNGTPVKTRADDPAWRGLAVRNARFYIPAGVPLLGGHAVDAYVEVGLQPGEGIQLAISTRIPASGSRPAIDVTIECNDPSAIGLQDFIPTLVELAMELPLDGTHQDAPGGGFNLLAGKPVIARLRFARSVADPETRLTLSVESQGEDGILTVVAPGGLGATVLITCAALATAIVADKHPAGADLSGVVLSELLAAAVGLSSCLQDKGRFTIHKVELASTGHGLPVGKQVKLLLDYSVDVLVQPINVGVLSVSMSDVQPMRVRNRNVGLTINLSPGSSGTQTLELDFSAADMEIEDPGGWLVNSPASLFDILGTRSGRGSMWIEVDLRFKLNLGPIQVSGATIRATLNEDGTVSGSLRGLDVSLQVPGVIDGQGALELLSDGGFSAALDVKILPIGLSTDGTVLYQSKNGSYWLFVQISTDLPGPIPIANTGLGIYGIGGAFGVNARPTPAPPDKDPITYQLNWDSSQPLTSFEFLADELTVGAQAVFGTVPDLGFSFSTRAGLFISVPDVVVRGSLWGKVMSPRMSVTDNPKDGDLGASFLGVAVVDPNNGVTVGLKGQLDVAVQPLRLLHIVVPLGAFFPTGDERANWYIYLGADGYTGVVPSDGRGLGPIRADLLPDLIDTHADAYLMLRGNGIKKWPRGGSINIPDGLVVAFGFGFDYTIGEPHIAWADIHASADILLAVHPLTLAGFGSAGGSLNLGPFSIGVDATLSLLMVQNNDPYIHVRLCGHIDLFFTEIEGCVEMSINSTPTLEVPVPDHHPLDDVENGATVGNLAFLIDDKYRRIGKMTTSPDDLNNSTDVWADTLLHLAFTVTPNLVSGIVQMVDAVPQFSPIDSYPSGLAAKPVGNDMLKYEWTLTGLALYDVTDDPHGPGTLAPGTMSAAWQAGKDGDLGTRPQAGELVLLTYQGDLWINPLTDAGTTLPDNPLAAAASACQREAVALASWAVGSDAALVGSSFVLPSDPLTPDPCVSRFTAQLTQQVSFLPNIPLSVSSAVLLPPPYDFAPAFQEAFAPVLALERDFSGALDLAVISGPPAAAGLLARVQPIQTARIEPQEPLQDARLWLIVNVFLAGAASLSVTDDLGQTWMVTNQQALPSARMALRFAPPSTGSIKYVEISWFVGVPVAVLGLGGITATAQAAAAARNAATQAEANRQSDAAGKQPQQSTDTTGPDLRSLLQPGHTYRLDVSMSWEGWLYSQDENGNTVQAGHRVSTDDPATASQANRQFFFRITPKPDPKKALPMTEIDYGTVAPSVSVDHLHLLRRRVDMFDPTMLTRFLLGYVPAQSETARYCDDPVSVHFSAAHVIALAHVYGYTLSCELQQLDAPGTAGDPFVLTPKWKGLTAPSLLSGADEVRFQIASTSFCSIPKPGGTLEASNPPLEPSSWYDLHVRATSDDSNVLDGRLDGVTFKTSRWRNPAEMLAGLGFEADPKAASGDIEIKQLPSLGPAVIEGSDADFEAALDATGLSGWPAAPDVRVSLIWLVQPAPSGAPPAWKFAGMLLESPEPVDRPGRSTIQALRVVMKPMPAGVFDIMRSDRSRSRILWLCSTPFVPQSWFQHVLFSIHRVFPTIALDLLDANTGTLTGSVQLPLAPSFAEEA